jgi:acyl carrier protein
VQKAVTVEGSASLTDLEREVATLIVGALRLEVGVGEFSPATPLYGDELGLDSIDNVENQRIFSSLRELASYVATHRTR